MSEKTIAIRVDEELHKQIKVRLAETGFTLKDYVISLVKKDLQKDMPIKWETFSDEDIIDEKSIKEAQKILDFVSNMLQSKNSKDD